MTMDVSKPGDCSWVRFGAVAVLVTAGFGPVLVRLVRFALGSELESYIPLIPFISIYLIYHGRNRILVTAPISVVSRQAACLCWAGAVVLLVLHFALARGGHLSGAAAGLFLPVLSCVTAIIGLFIHFCGIARFRAALFPTLFLYLMAPIPEPVATLLRNLLQHGSAEATEALFLLAGTPVFRDGLIFHLPGLSVQVAEPCSGIHSSLVLFITSLVAGHLFLKRTANRVWLALSVIPISLFRNGLRVVVLSLLTVYVDPAILAGPLHRHGGPLFFLLSLVVGFGVLWGLRWLEKRG